MTRRQGADLGERYVRLMTGQHHPLGNAAIVCEPQRLTTTRTAVTPLLERDTPSMVVYPEGVSETIASWLESRGFEGHGAMPAMAVDIEAMGATTLPRGYQWRRMGAGGEGRAWADAVATGFGIPPDLARMFSPEGVGADPAPDARVQFFAITSHTRIVSTSMLFCHDGLAGVYNVSTTSAHRGRGLGAHATAQALRVAQRLGYRVGVLQSSDAGHAVYLQLGFRDCAALPWFVRMLPAAAGRI